MKYTLLKKIKSQLKAFWNQQQLENLHSTKLLPTFYKIKRYIQEL